MKTPFLIATLLLAISCNGSDSKKKSNSSSEEYEEETSTISEEEEESEDLSYYNEVKGLKCEVVGLEENKEVFLIIKDGPTSAEKELRMLNVESKHKVNSAMIPFGKFQAFGLHTMKITTDGTWNSDNNLLSYETAPVHDGKSTSYVAVINFESDFSSGTISTKRFVVSDRPHLVKEELELARFEGCVEETAYSIIKY